MSKFRIGDTIKFNEKQMTDVTKYNLEKIYDNWKGKVFIVRKIDGKIIFVEGEDRAFIDNYFKLVDGIEFSNEMKYKGAFKELKDYLTNLRVGCDICTRHGSKRICSDCSIKDIQFYFDINSIKYIEDKYKLNKTGE